MNCTLKNLALLSFKRKARRLGKNITVVNCTERRYFIPDYSVREGETLIIWGEENGFHSILSKSFIKLLDLVTFPDKYNYDEIYHFGVLSFDKTSLYVYRCHDQLTHNNEVLVYGLQYQKEEYRKNQDFVLQQERELPFLQQGQGSRL